MVNSEIVKHAICGAMSLIMLKEAIQLLNYFVRCMVLWYATWYMIDGPRPNSAQFKVASWEAYLVLSSPGSGGRAGLKINCDDNFLESFFTAPRLSLRSAIKRRRPAVPAFASSHPSHPLIWTGWWWGASCPGPCQGLGKGRHQWKKNVFFQALPQSPKPPPPLTPIRATWSFFSDVKIQDLKVPYLREDSQKKRFAKMWGGEGDILTT